MAKSNIAHITPAPPHADLADPPSESKTSLLAWYRENKRELPWRENRDPYRIWISETMLQQTTTAAVIPFFERFISRFPSLQELAAAKVEAVIEAWAGLGYYSRARNLHKSALALHQQGGFPRTHLDLLEFPGFGPYTARSVASLAFDESVGVVDGNVIRVLSRFHGQGWEWWRAKVRERIQSLANAWVQGLPSAEMNQALMELGRTICAPKQTACLLCPLRPNCRAFARESISDFPKTRPRRERELWLWQPYIEINKGKIRLERNRSAPFLRGQWLLPAHTERVPFKPKTFDYRHSITHHDIFVTVRRDLPKMTQPESAHAESLWVPLKEIRQYVPVSLVEKALAARKNLVLVRQPSPPASSCERAAAPSIRLSNPQDKDQSKPNGRRLAARKR